MPVGRWMKGETERGSWTRRGCGWLAAEDAVLVSGQDFGLKSGRLVQN